MDKKLIGPHSQSGRGGEEKSSIIVCRELIPGLPAYSLVSVQTFILE